MKIDTKNFEKEIVMWGNEEQELLCAKIIINGTPLIEIIRDYELPYAKKYNQENIAGSYIYNYAKYLYELLSDRKKSQEYENGIPILICQCGSEGCWDLLIMIEESETEVTWTNFHNPRRSSPTSPGGFWNYSGFPSFHFDKEQYKSVISELAKIV